MLKDSVQISRLFIMLLYHTTPNKRSLASSIWRFPILLLYFDHRLMKVLLIIFLAGNMYRACLFGVQISDISNQEKRKRLQTLIIISVAFDAKNYYSGLFYSSSTLERVSSFLKKIAQTINLAESCLVPLFPELLLPALHSINLHVVSSVEYT